MRVQGHAEQTLTRSQTVSPSKKKIGPDTHKRRTITAREKLRRRKKMRGVSGMLEIGQRHNLLLPFKNRLTGNEDGNGLTV